jgi:hypothetical protein
MTSLAAERNRLQDKLAAGLVGGLVTVPIWFAAAVFALWLAYSVGVLGLQFRDAYVPFSGRIVAKGANNWTLRRQDNDYLVIREAAGRDHRRYVSRREYVMAKVGSSVSKPRGFHLVRRPGQLTPFQLLDSLDRTRDQRRKSLMPP